MISFTTQGSARAWVGASDVEAARVGETIATDIFVARLQKRPPMGRVGRCPGKPGEGGL